MCLRPDQLTGRISSLLWLVRQVHAIPFWRHFTDDGDLDALFGGSFGGAACLQVVKVSGKSGSGKMVCVFSHVCVMWIDTSLCQTLSLHLVLCHLTAYVEEAAVWIDMMGDLMPEWLTRL